MKKIASFIFVILCFSSGFSQSDTIEEIEPVVGIHETPPEFPGGYSKLQSFLQLVKSYPDSAKARGIEGKVYVQFVVKKTGKLSDFEVLRSPDTLLSHEALRIVRLMPNWSPGINLNGDSVDIKMVWPINFKINNEPVFQVVETMPEFEGGYSKLIQYLGQNVKFSQPEKELRLTSRYYFEFIIEKDGSISNFKQIRGKNLDFYNYVVLVFNNMPNWEPGKQNGEAVRVKMVLPIGIHWK